MACPFTRCHYWAFRLRKLSLLIKCVIVLIRLCLLRRAKDSVSVSGMYLTAGMYMRKGFRAREDAAVVRNLRQAGAIAIALTNVPEAWYVLNFIALDFNCVTSNIVRAQHVVGWHEPFVRTNQQPVRHVASTWWQQRRRRRAHFVSRLAGRRGLRRRWLNSNAGCILR